MTRLLLIFVLAFAALASQGARAVADVPGAVADAHFSGSDAPKWGQAEFSALDETGACREGLEPWDPSLDDDDPPTLCLSAVPLRLVRHGPLPCPLPGDLSLVSPFAWRPPAV